MLRNFRSLIQICQRVTCEANDSTFVVQQSKVIFDMHSVT